MTLVFTRSSCPSNSRTPTTIHEEDLGYDIEKGQNDDLKSVIFRLKTPQEVHHQYFTEMDWGRQWNHHPWLSPKKIPLLSELGPKKNVLGIMILVNIDCPEINNNVGEVILQTTLYADVEWLTEFVSHPVSFICYVELFWSIVQMEVTIVVNE